MVISLTETMLREWDVADLAIPVFSQSHTGRYYSHLVARTSLAMVQTGAREMRCHDISHVRQQLLHQFSVIIHY